jgi:hypothetical protein
MQWDQKIGDFTPEDNSVIFGLTASSVSVFILKLRWPVEKPVMGKAPMSEVTKSDKHRPSYCSFPSCEHPRPVVARVADEASRSPYALRRFEDGENAREAIVKPSTSSLTRTHWMMRRS